MDFWHFNPLFKKQKLTSFLLFLILALAFFLRTYKNTQSPPGFYTDEASIGYNAYSILKTAKDEHGIFLPLFFKAFGEFKNPVFIYSLPPLIALFGLQVKTIRLAAALWGTLGVLAIFFFAKSISKNNFYALLSALILTLMPWQLHYSRIAFEAISFPCLLILALFFFQKWLADKKIASAFFFSFFLSLAFFSYTTARFWIPLLFFFLLFLFCKNFWQNKYQSLVIFFFFFCFIVCPVYAFEKIFPGALTSSFKIIAVWNDAQNFNEVAKRFLLNFINHWSPKFLFFKGDPNIRHSSGISSEMLISWFFPFIFGFIYAFKKFLKNKIWQLIIFLILSFPLAASLTRTQPIATRTLQAAPFFSLIISLFFYQTSKVVFAKNLFIKKKLFSLFFLVFFLSFSLLEFSFYFSHLLNIYPQKAGRPWHGFDANLAPALFWAKKTAQSKKKSLYLSSKIENAYIQGLFFYQADPKIWQLTKTAPFKVIEETDALPEGIIVLTQKDCLEKEKDNNLHLLKKFGSFFNQVDYCLVEKTASSEIFD